ncbi:MAG: T9SS type A sorting domain-containing protein [Prolixibacteraceae bacterium]|nr:T9SS type A sorting domain-containing protein [Prolixibacteraceae bacterium]
MKKHLLYLLILAFMLCFGVNATAQGSLTHSFSFQEGTPTDDVTGEDAILIGDAFIDGSDLILPGGDSHMDMSTMGFEINSYEALTLEIWATSEAGANTGFTMLCYLGGSTNGLGTQGCFISAARGDDVSRGAISTVNMSAPYGEAETGANGPEYDDGTFHSYVLTIDESFLYFYIDGELQGEGDLAIVGNGIWGLSNDFAYVGKGGYTADPCWIGTIHKFNIYNAALSEGEVADLTVDPNVQINNVTLHGNNFKPDIYTANNRINISLNHTGFNSGQAELFNITGQRIANVNFNNETSIESGRGLYIVKVKANDKIYSQKVVVQ